MEQLKKRMEYFTQDRPLIYKIYTAQHKKMQNGPHHLGMVEHITSQLKKPN